ncbi:hypothetical protein JYU34_017173 [Plutella xylostella]|uniref:Uncharacterized protein n=1 Tax=Plutella xylostella TaxID=51655 RepID=A0ABQ7Q0J2_PLUXY|nr:hypothetical protein JYU34_017173 [Plutella xylostella]
MNARLKNYYAMNGGGGLVQQLRKSYSLSDLTECEPRDERGVDEADDVLAEPHVIRRNVARSGYNTRRSASESTRSLHFPEVDVDVRARVDEPDLSHIKSSEDISSGYSSADNSGSLTRAASVGRTRPRPRTTSVKRPAAAEGSEVTIEELLDDDLEYTSMPPLMNVPSPLFLSHSDPPFIYQYVGDQVRIVQVLGDNPLFANTATKNPIPEVKGNLNEVIQLVDEKIDSKDTKDVIEVKTEIIKLKAVPDSESSVSVVVDTEADEPFFEIDSNNNDIEKKPEVSDSNNNEKTAAESAPEIQNKDIKEPESKIQEINTATTVVNVISSTIEQVDSKKLEVNEDVPKSIDENKDACETTSLDASLYESETAESDDEASFGTPEDSPKTRRKSPRGRYGKGKAPPPPPKVDIVDTKDEGNVAPSELHATESKESLVDIVNSLPSSALQDVVASTSLVVNPISEKKRRHKSKSPNRLPKAAIGKLLQLPGKLAFWHKNDSKSKGERDSASVSSNDVSRRSSIIEKFDDAETIEVLDVVEEINTQIIPLSNKADDQISFKDASSDVESEVMGHNIMEKSDALQKLIEAKIESHPEYKITVVAQEIPSPSKSTDV